MLIYLKYKVSVSSINLKKYKQNPLSKFPRLQQCSEIQVFGFFEKQYALTIHFTVPLVESGQHSVVNHINISAAKHMNSHTKQDKTHNRYMGIQFSTCQYMNLLVKWITKNLSVFSFFFLIQNFYKKLQTCISSETFSHPLILWLNRGMETEVELKLL